MVIKLNMSSSSVVIFPAMIMSSSKYRFPQKLLRIRAQSYRDEGKSRHVVDANLRVLRERMEEVKMKERLEKCLVCEQGWNYRSATISSADLCLKKKRKKEMEQFFELIWMVGGTIGFTILGCTFCLYLTSLLIHFNHY